ncbi:MAG: roadblock/LC7 domain-containing protein [Thermoplasmata archaeon]
MTYGDMLASLRKDCKAIATAIVSKDGAVVASDVPKDISRETFAIMSATIMGAGVTAAIELKKEPPRRIVLESENAKTVIMNASRKKILVVVVPSATDTALVEQFSEGVLSALREE